MTDTASPETPKTSTTRKYLAPLLVGVAAIALVGLLASRSGLDKALLKQQLDDFGARLHESALKQGRDVTFTYGDVGIKGSFSHKHGVIENPKFTIKSEHDGSDEVLVITTAEADIYPKAADLSALEIQLPQALEFTGDDITKKLLTVKAAEPLTFDVAKTEENGVQYVDFRHPAPSRLEFTYLREHEAQGEEDKTPTIVPVFQTLALTFAPGGSIASHMSTDDKHLGTSTIDLHEIHLIPQSVPNGEIKIDEIALHSSNMLNDKNQVVAALKVHVGDISASPDFIPYAPMSLVVDGSYEGAATQTPEDVAAIGKQQSSMKLTEFALTTKDAKLTANADFATRDGDALPEGNANITLTNVPYVMKELTDNGILNDTNIGLVTPVLEMTTGQKLPEIKDAVIDIKRPHGGSFTIGKSTFEELFAVVLKSALTRQPLPPKTPDAAAPAPAKSPAKGAMIIEDSARG